MDHRIMNINPDASYNRSYVSGPTGISPNATSIRGVNAFGPQRMIMTPGNRILPSQVVNRSRVQDILQFTRRNAKPVTGPF